MPDHATSSSPAVQTQLDRLSRLSPGADILGLERITQLLARLDNPHHRLPPVFHVAGTNGKGSTCAFLRAALEADGRQVHVFTSPHLVRFNERIRLAGTLISDHALATYLSRVLDIAEGVNASFFEVTSAAAFLAFAEIPADALILEVGLGGRLDATNVVQNPAVTGIAQLGIDHQFFLGDTISQIAAEKAGIAKPGAHLITFAYAPAVAQIIGDRAAAAGAPWITADRDWRIAPIGDDMLRYEDASGTLDLPRPSLPGSHQMQNLGLAIAMLRHQSAVPITDHALRAAATQAQWPARLQHLATGPFTAPLGSDAEVWLDGGHNPDAGQALARHFAGHRASQPKFPILIGMLSNKDAAGFLAPLIPCISHIHVVPVPCHEWHPAETFAAILSKSGTPVTAHDSPEAAIRAIASNAPDRLLICGSLYLAGDILAKNGELPD